MPPPPRQPPWTTRPIRPDEREWAFALEHAVMGDHLAASRGLDEAEHRVLFDTRIFDERLQVIELGDERVGLLRLDDREGSCTWRSSSSTRRGRGGASAGRSSTA